ncbi:hypothetical protein FLONG3_6545 [Fusarium longipes]|uniref:Uncharacterized protein n=1 Tax=Fusarium longipes TaxID=694270 RepID=A0A395SLD3_9HYPO|nr:hypothetical protein FLONG3_6545 [Fusarium longipes]
MPLLAVFSEPCDGWWQATELMWTCGLFDETNNGTAEKRKDGVRDIILGLLDKDTEFLPPTTIQSSQAVVTSSVTESTYSETTPTAIVTSSFAEVISSITTTIETSSTASSTTSEAPEPIATFTLVAANVAAQTEVNGETLKFRKSNPGLLVIRPVPHAVDDFQTGEFSVEPSTNRLKMGNRYVVSSASPNSGLGTAYDDYRAKYIICTPPLMEEQKLSCIAQATDRNKWMVNVDVENGLFIRSGDEELGPDDHFEFVDMIVRSV